MEINLADLRVSVAAGSHEGWNRVVEMLKGSKTPLMGITVWEAFLIVAFRHSYDAWGLVAAPTITYRDALRSIARCHQEARASDIDTPIFDGDGIVQYRLPHPPEKDDEKPQIASLPVGLVFVGKSTNTWADEAALVNVDLLAAILGRSREEELGLLQDFASSAASTRIAKLIGN